MKAVYIIPLTLSATDIITHKLHDSLQLPGLRPGLYVYSLMQKSVILNTCCTVREFLEQ